MALKIKWTPEAQATFDNIVSYLEKEWSEKEIESFIGLVDKILK